MIQKSKAVFRGCGGGLAVGLVLVAVAGCQAPDETPKSKDYYSGPMKGKKVTGVNDNSGAPAPVSPRQK